MSRYGRIYPGPVARSAEQAAELAATSPSCRPFALRLQRLAEQFQSKAALQLVRSAMRDDT